MSIRRGVVALAAISTLALGALGIAACGDDDGEEGGQNAAVFTAISALDNAGLHEIETEIVETGTPPGDAQATALRMQTIVKLTDWPKDLQADADKLAQYLGEMASALGGNDKEKMKEASGKAHDAAHDLSHEAWIYLQKQAGVSAEMSHDASEPTATKAAGTGATAGATNTASKITIENARARASNSDVSAAYFVVKNGGPADKLLSASVDPAIAGMVQLHTMVMEGGTAKMQQVMGIDVPANGSVELKPGGFHVMLMNVKRELKEGETITLQLKFEKAGTIEVKAPIQTITSGNSMSGSGSGMSSGMGGGVATPTMAGH